MPFSFRITRIHDLPYAGFAVLEGDVAFGYVRTGEVLALIHGDVSVPFRAEGVVLGPREKGSPLTLSARLNQAAMHLMRVGDLLVSTDVPQPRAELPAALGRLLHD